MAEEQRDGPPSFQLQDLCRCLGVRYRDARYLCERGRLPEGVERQPGRGNHRQLTPAQAVWLGIVLRLKECGVTTDAAAEIATFADKVKGVSRSLGWDWRFSPFDGGFHTDRRWLLEVGDGRFFRFVTDANPSKEGLYEFPWIDMEHQQPAPDATPVVCLRVDISALANLLRGLKK